jgi:small subunit ribosomal protein S18
VSGAIRSTTFRLFSDKDNKDNTNNKKDPAIPEDPLVVANDPLVAADQQSEDPFGIHFDDGIDQGRVGPEAHLPPKYKRDTTTGQLTGDIEHELSEEEKRILKADPLEKQQLLVRRVERHWSKEGTDKAGQPRPLDKLGEGVRQADMGINVLGRSVQAQASKEQLEDGSHLGRDDSGFSQRLTKKEFEAFSSFMKKEHTVEVTKDDIPVQENHSHTAVLPGDDDTDVDDLDLSMKWLTTRAQRQMDDSLDDNPYSDLVPGDLNPSRLVNRKRAKPIPAKLLHHNNVELLQRFMTPTGQISSRVQTRLGARDQRRVAKLVKRARALGLMPYSGQFKAEQHGWVHAKDIDEEREWERELTKRGLVIKRSAEDELDE